MMEELRTCPFCGSDVKVKVFEAVPGFYSYQVWCKNPKCSLLARFITIEPDKDETVKAWNTRYEPTCHAVSGHGIPTKVFCARCDEPLLGAANYCPNCGARVVEVEE